MSVLALETPFAVTLSPAPAYEPPFDDETTERAGAGTPPLPFASAAYPAYAPLGDTPSPRRLTLVPPLPPTPADDDALFGPQPCGTDELPEVRQWSHGFVQAVLEAVEGRRGLGQIARFLSPALGAELERRAGVRARIAGARGATLPTLVRSVHVCEVADGVAEISAVVRRGMRTVAVALRLEGVDGRWLCTALQI